MTSITTSKGLKYGIAAGLLLLLASSLGTAAYGLHPRLPEEARVGDWAIGGLTPAELEEQLAAKEAAVLSLPVRLAVKEGEARLTKSVTLGQLGLQLDHAELQARLQPLRQGSPWERALARWRLRGASWPIGVQLPEDQLHAALAAAFAEVYARKAADAQRVIEADDTIRYVPERGAPLIDEAKLRELLLAKLPPWGSVAGAPLSAPPPDSPEAGAASAAPQPLELDVPMLNAAPGVTVQSLQAQGIARKLSEFTTGYPPGTGSSRSSEGRIHNVRSTATTIHDVLLKPGEVFDYAPYIAETEKRFGFREAPVIVNGKLVPGVGGGICQVSSTLYNAVLRAGLTIVERRNHSLPVSYVPLGQDATFATGHIGFKFRNSTEHYLLIRTSATDRSMTVKLYGQSPPELTYDIVSKTVETLPPPVKYVHNPLLRKGKQETLIKGKPGYVVETFRRKLQNGVVMSQEKISRDTYSAQPTVIASGNGSSTSQDRSTPRPGSSPREPLIEDGVKGPNYHSAR
ncbi:MULTISPECIES: VanW family protein [Paenibacillus]|uniref:VanW family protein n=1 Tax=Paenibacillus TaxID=44249 RepID=UPI0022B90505|nr:VanW family protein [Paenibacillus caseinilyticus]MCZ8523587.1 VanW family protein [Paenibacillus caseinilyticus]